MYDIVSTPELAEIALSRGITPLVLERDVALVSAREAIKQTAHLLVLGTVPNLSLFSGPIDGIVSVENHHKKDKLSHRRSGLDPALCKELAKHQKALILSFSAVKNSTKPGVLLGRMIQNVRFAKKYNVPVIVASFATNENELVNPTDMVSFFTAMGCDENVMLKSHAAFTKWVARAEHRASDKYIAEGVQRA